MFKNSLWKEWLWWIWLYTWVYHWPGPSGPRIRAKQTWLWILTQPFLNDLEQVTEPFGFLICRMEDNTVSWFLLKELVHITHWSQLWCTPEISAPQTLAVVTHRAVWVWACGWQKRHDELGWGLSSSGNIGDHSLEGGSLEKVLTEAALKERQEGTQRAQCQLSQARRMFQGGKKVKRIPVGEIREGENWHWTLSLAVWEDVH